MSSGDQVEENLILAERLLEQVRLQDRLDGTTLRPFPD
jgi:hypothetical protein